MRQTRLEAGVGHFTSEYQRHLNENEKRSQLPSKQLGNVIRRSGGYSVILHLFKRQTTHARTRTHTRESISRRDLWLVSAVSSPYRNGTIALWPCVSFCCQVTSSTCPASGPVLEGHAFSLKHRGVHVLTLMGTGVVSGVHACVSCRHGPH